MSTPTFFDLIKYGELFKAMEKLTPSQEDALVLRFWSNLSYAEIGKRMQISKQRVGQLLTGFRGHKAGRIYDYLGALERIKEAYLHINDKVRQKSERG